MLRVGLLIAAAIYGLDRLTKWLAVDVWNIDQRKLELGPFLNLDLVWNPGVSFGMLQSDAGIAQWLLGAFGFAVVLALTVWLWRTRSGALASGLGLVIGGALGNLSDRILWGAVADFVDFHVGALHWPVFNVADTAIVVGFGLIVVDGLFAGRSRSIKGNG